MSFDFGFDFRATRVGFVTDPPYAIGIISFDTYQSWINGNGNGINAGWMDSNVSTADQSAGNDPRLAGIAYNHFGNAGSPSFTTFQVTLPHTGRWSIQLAAGDPGNAQNIYLTIFDNTVPLVTFTNVATGAANSFMDATGTVYTAANWLTSETPVIFNFASTTMNVQLGPTSPTGTNSTVLAHLRVTDLLGVPGGAGGAQVFGGRARTRHRSDFEA